MSNAHSSRYAVSQSHFKTWEDYYSVEEQTITIHKQVFRVSTKKGAGDWDQPIQCIQLLDFGFPSPKHSNTNPKILLFGTGNGILVTYFSRLFPNSAIWGTDLSFSNLELCKNTVQLNQLQNIHIFPDHLKPDSYLAHPNENFDIAVIQLPKGRSIARRWLVQAHRSLSLHGFLYLLGSNNEGIQSVAKDASEVFGNIKLLGYKNKGRIYQSTKLSSSADQPDWVFLPGIAPGTWNKIAIEIGGDKYILHTLPGVFSYDHLDHGTELLLENINLEPSSLILDIGCGYGIIGIFAASHGARAVHMADNNLYANASTYENIRINDLSNVQLFPSDLYFNLRSFTYDAILSNPPFHTGQAIDYQIAHVLIAQGFRKLNPGGSLTIVANRFLPYHKQMQAVFKNVTTLQETSKYHVLKSVRDT